MFIARQLYQLRLLLQYYLYGCLSLLTTVIFYYDIFTFRKTITFGYFLLHWFSDRFVVFGCETEVNAAF